MEVVTANENTNNNNSLLQAGGVGVSEAGGKYEEIPEDRVLANLTLTVQLDLNQNHPMFKDPVTENQPMLNHLLNSADQIQQQLQESLNKVVLPVEDKRRHQVKTPSQTTSGTLTTTGKSTSNTTSTTTATSFTNTTTTSYPSINQPSKDTTSTGKFKFSDDKPIKNAANLYFRNYNDSSTTTNTPSTRVIGGSESTSKGQPSYPSTTTTTTALTNTTAGTPVTPGHTKLNATAGSSGYGSNAFNDSVLLEAKQNQSQSMDNIDEEYLSSGSSSDPLPDRRQPSQPQRTEQNANITSYRGMYEDDYFRQFNRSGDKPLAGYPLRNKYPYNQEFQADLRLNYQVTGAYDHDFSRTEKLKRNYKEYYSKYKLNNAMHQQENFVLQIEREFADNTDDTKVYIRALELQKAANSQEVDHMHLFGVEVDLSNKSKVSDLKFQSNGHLIDFSAWRNANENH